MKVELDAIRELQATWVMSIDLGSKPRYSLNLLPHKRKGIPDHGYASPRYSYAGSRLSCLSQRLECQFIFK
jgi:hypothetical protein